LFKMWKFPLAWNSILRKLWRADQRDRAGGRTYNPDADARIYSRSSDSAIFACGLCFVGAAAIVLLCGILVARDCTGD